MIAHLGMYDVPDANAAFWTLIRAALGYGPDHLTHSDDVWSIWQSPDLLLSQTCGYPYRARLHGQVTLVGTPDYGLDGCDPGYYRSILIAHADDARTELGAFDGAAFAYNDALSQSGWAGPTQHMLDLKVAPGAHLKTGSHAASLRAVASGSADFAGLDAMTWRVLRDLQPNLTNRCKVVDHTRQTPGLPYICAPGRDVGALQSAIDDAISNLAVSDAHRLGIRSLVRIPAAQYLSVPTPPPPPGH